MSGRKWTEAEDVKLREMNQDKKTQREISRELERTIDSVKGRFRVLGLTNSALWNEENVQYLKDHYETKTVNEFSRELEIGRSLVIEKLKAMNIYLGNDGYREWQQEEDSYLKEKYLVYSYSRIARDLKRTTSSVAQHALLLGLIKPVTKRFSTSDIDYLKENYQTSTIDELVSVLKRPTHSIYNKAYELGLGELSKDLKREEVLFILANAKLKTDSEISEILHCSPDKIATVRKNNNLLKNGSEINGKTNIESIVEKELLNLNVGFLYNSPLQSYVPDFQFSNSNKIIEVQGDYWHCNPRIYKEGPKDPIQIKHVLNDYYKMCFYIGNGFDVLYLWEDEIINNFPSVQEKIKHFILPSPEETPVMMSAE